MVDRRQQRRAVVGFRPPGLACGQSRHQLSRTNGPRAVATRALETIDEDPIIGAPLFEPLRGYWSYRSEGIRIIYRIVTEARFIVVLNIGLVMAR